MMLLLKGNEATVGIFWDFLKAFDTINHDILLYKLEYYGFRGITLIVKSYLSNRKYLLVIKCMTQITKLSTVMYLKDLS